MKKYISTSILGLTMLLAYNSCSLDEMPKTMLTEEQVYDDDENIQLLVSGLYTQWRNTKQDRGGFMFTLGTDEAQQGAQQIIENNTQGSLDSYNNGLNPSNTSLAEQWSKRWPVITAAAKAIHYAKTPDLEAQARFIRATLNFELVMLWGPIPIIDQSDMREARQPEKDVFETVIQDLEYAAEHLEDEPSDKKVPSKGAALALLGKVYLYAPETTELRDYEKAMVYFDQVIPRYQLVENYADLFNTSLNQNNSESIYAFQFINISPDNNMAQHHVGSRAVAELDGNCYFGGYDLLMPTTYYANDINEGGIWEPGDRRKLASIRYDFTLPDGRVPKITWTGQEDELGPHTKKYEDIRTQGKQNFWHSGGLIYYLRLSDILLAKAECLNELGRTNEAITLLNTTVRKRAFENQIPTEHSWEGLSQSELRGHIMDERIRELGFEGWRRMDLIRTGNLVNYVSQRNPWAKAAGNIKEFHNRYPIPESEIKQNDFINESDQNPGY